jgi:DNA repair exonuclease SbcCD nuclease subunit
MSVGGPKGKNAVGGLPTGSAFVDRRRSELVMNKNRTYTPLPMMRVGCATGSPVPFTFLHTADWQIGKRFGRFPAEIAVMLGEARFEAIDRLARIAIENGAGHVLVAGDIFDSETIPEKLVRRLWAKLEAHGRLQWHLLPGNHDPARPGGLWAGIKALPPNVRVHAEPEACEIAPGVLLLTSPLVSKATSTDPTAWMDAAPSGAGILRVGLAHGSVRGFGSLEAAAVQIAPDRAQRARLDYLALGDWHGTQEIGARTWYAGTPEPDSFSDNAPGHALVVRLTDSGSPPAVTMVAAGAYRWLERRLLVSGIGDVDRVVSEIEGLGTATSRHLLSLFLEGRLPIADRARLEAHIVRLESRLMHLRLDRSGLRLAAEAAELQTLQAGALRAVAERLAAAARADDADARIAAEALARLLAFDAQLEDGGGS